MTPQLAVTYRPTGALIPFARNSRTHDESQIRQLVASIREFGFTNPVLVDADGGIIAGHGRVEAAQLLELAEIPTIELVGLSEAQKRAYVIADNKLALNAGWDDELLLAELKDLGELGYDLDLTGFDADEIAVLEDGFRTGEKDPPDPDAVPPLQPIAVAKPGDVWQLGRHRVLCGSCRDEADVAHVMAGSPINLAFTSPPYASQREYDTNSVFRPIPPDDFVEWYAPAAAAIHAHLAADGSYFCNIKPSADGLDTSLYVFDLVIAHVRRWGWHFATEYCWERNGVPKGVTQRFKNQFEPIYQFAKGRWKMRPDAVRHASLDVPQSLGKGSGNTTWKDAQGNSPIISADRVKGSDRNRGRGNTKSLDQMQGSGDDIGEHIGAGLAYPGNRLPTFAGSHDATGHTAAFPVGLPEFFVKAYTDPDDAIFDPFMGSGSTLIAAEKQDRRAFGTEISPLYVDMIVRRWQNFTGRDATLESDGRSFAEVSDGR